MTTKFKLICIFLLCLFSFGCRGWRSEKPPIHLNPNLDFQASIKSQENPMYSPENTIPWGNSNSFSNIETRKKYIKEDSRLYFGKNTNGSWVRTIPVNVNYELLNRGKERYDIFCSSCHGLDGSGNGPIVDGRWIKPVSYWHERVVNYRDGQLFDIISNGIRSMPAYSQQISENDRWAIVSYIRALQKSNNVKFSELPIDLKNQLKARSK